MKYIIPYFRWDFRFIHTVFNTFKQSVNCLVVNPSLFYLFVPVKCLLLFTPLFKRNAYFFFGFETRGS